MTTVSHKIAVFKGGPSSFGSGCMSARAPLRFSIRNGRPLSGDGAVVARRNSVMPKGVEDGVAPEQTVEGLCNTLARYGLLPPEEVRKLYQRWKNERPGGDVTAFTRWLADNRYVSEFQAGVLGRGHAESLVLGPYTVIERIGRGRMAGVYRA